MRSLHPHGQCSGCDRRPPAMTEVSRTCPVARCCDQHHRPVRARTDMRSDRRADQEIVICSRGKPVAPRDRAANSSMSGAWPCRMATSSAVLLGQELDQARSCLAARARPVGRFDDAVLEGDDRLDRQNAADRGPCRADAAAALEVLERLQDDVERSRRARRSSSARRSRRRTALAAAISAAC